MMTDRDRINRIDALCEIERFRQGIYCSKEQSEEASEINTILRKTADQAQQADWQISRLF